MAGLTFASLLIGRGPSVRTDLTEVACLLNERQVPEVAAGIQAFPRDMQWRGPQAARSRQDGNAVPPVLAWHVAAAVSAAIVLTQAREG